MDTRKEFKEAMLQRGYDKKFIKEYRSELYRQNILDKYSAGDPTVWDDVQNLFDEYNYFCAGFDAVAYEENAEDTEVIMMTNEAWL